MVKVETKKVKLSKINLNPDNPRQISEKDMDRLVKSLQEFPDMMKLREIVVDENMMVLGGNMRTLALRKIGLVDCTAKIVTGLLLEQKREFIIKDNSAFGEWDMDILSAWDDLPLVEWGVDLPEEWLTGGEKEGLTDPDEVPEVPKVAITKPGDIWLLGKHLVMCGDSTKAEDVERLLNGAKPNLMVTDPPYGVNYDALWRAETGTSKEGKTVRISSGKAIGEHKLCGVGKVMNDDRSDWREAWVLFPGDVAYIWHAMKTAFEVSKSLLESDYEIRAEIVWAKNQLVISRGHYHPQHESCFYAVRNGATGHWIGDHKQTTLWEIDKPSKSETGHSTQKPVECMERPIKNHEGDVYDPFGGSGTTLIAAEQTGRTAFLMELDPLYVDVTVQRWEQFTGERAVLA